MALVTREALGVVAAIVPWNFPTVMAAWKIGPALATGNSVIVKPSEKSPLTAILLADLAKQAGIPDGVFQVLPGFGHEAGQALALHNDVDCITFTGSTAVGKKLLSFAGESNLKRAFMECGGKSLILFIMTSKIWKRLPQLLLQRFVTIKVKSVRLVLVCLFTLQSRKSLRRCYSNTWRNGNLTIRS
ncbi:aldehyde dehydrogenase [Vibrio maritimus]|uniref:Aldehyde dehydrogenase n=1 Tax=Vibrio maritimus TaxID=990268 RepID=A0A090RRW0_9VIBR|nr:aldehyde dehydrogenase [Vibrio maritimus]